MADEKNPFEGDGSPEPKKDKLDELIEIANKRSAENAAKRKGEHVSKPKTEKKPRAKKEAKPKAEKKPRAKKEAKPKAEKKPRAKKPAKPKKESNRAGRVVLTEKQLAEPRETIRIRPAIIAMVDKFAKKWEMETNEAAEKMLTTAVGRLNALARYNEG